MMAFEMLFEAECSKVWINLLVATVICGIGVGIGYMLGKPEGGK